MVVAYTPVEFTKGSLTEVAETPEQHAQLTWEGWIPTGNPVPATRPESLTFWRATEQVTVGAVRVAPTGETIRRNAGGVTRSSYDATERAGWTVVSGGAASTTNTIVILGDSHLAYATDDTAGVWATSDRGFWTWLDARLGRRLTLLKNAGIGGQRTDQILARVQTDAVALSPGWCLELSGTNDMIQGISVETAKANRLAIWQALRAAGIRVITGTIPPYDAATAAQAAWIFEMNRWVKEQAGVVPGLTVVDFFAAVADPANGKWATGTALVDGIHSSRAGAAALSNAAFRVLDPLVPKFDPLLSANGDPNNSLPNGMFTGNTAGLSTSWSLFTLAVGTATATPTKVARTDGQPGEWQQVVVAPTKAAEGFDLRTNITTGFAIGDSVYAECEIEMDADTANWQFTRLHAFPTNAALGQLGVNVFDFSPFQTTIVTPSANRLVKAVLRTRSFVVPATTARLFWSLQHKGEGTVRVARASFRKGIVRP